MENDPVPDANPAARPPALEERAPMVGWYDPGQLVRTGTRVAVSTLFGENADRRTLDAVVHGEVDICDHSKGEELWIDYVSDTGDGWNSTYAVAHQLAQPVLELSYASSGTPPESYRTARGQLLVFGGDAVYPTADRDEYERRLVAPYRTALPRVYGVRPTVFAVPGTTASSRSRGCSAAVASARWAAGAPGRR